MYLTEVRGKVCGDCAWCYVPVYPRKKNEAFCIIDREDTYLDWPVEDAECYRFEEGHDA